jgi:hypothetical protein
MLFWSGCFGFILKKEIKSSQLISVLNDCRYFAMLATHIDEIWLSFNGGPDLVLLHYQSSFSVVPVYGTFSINE